MKEFEEHEFGRRFKQMVAYGNSDFPRATMQRFMMVIEEAKKDFPQPWMAGDMLDFHRWEKEVLEWKEKWFVSGKKEVYK